MRSPLRRSAAAAIAVAAVAALALVGVRLAFNGGDPSAFIVAGDSLTDSRVVPGDIAVNRDSSGYDGQLVYRLALDPATAKKTDFGITLDNPPYRQQRILYPALAWLLSGGGRPGLLPSVLIGINVVCLLALAWLGARLAAEHGRPPVHGAVLALTPAFAVSLARDLNEIVAMTFVVAALVALRRSRPAPAGVMLALAALARETTLVVPLALAAVWLWRRWRRPAAPEQLGASSFVIPIVVAAAWQLVLLARWGTMPVVSSEGNLSLPFAGVLGAITRNVEAGTLEAYGNLGLLAVTVVLTAMVAVQAWRSRALVHEKACLFGALSLQPLVGWKVWSQHVGFVRSLAEVFAIGMVVLLASRDVASDRVLLALSGLWGALAFLHAAFL